MKKQYKYLLFDLDGTLTDPKEGITRMRTVCAAKFRNRGEKLG